MIEKYKMKTPLGVFITGVNRHHHRDDYGNVSHDWVVWKTWNGEEIVRNYHEEEDDAISDFYNIRNNISLADKWMIEALNAGNNGNHKGAATYAMFAMDNSYSVHEVEEEE